MQNSSSTFCRALAIDTGFFATKVVKGRSPTGEFVVGSLPSYAAPVYSRASLSTGVGPAPRGAVIRVDGLDYFVGPDVLLVLKESPSRAVVDDYCRQPDYLALTLGALQEAAQYQRAHDGMEVGHLVVGLPVSAMTNHAGWLKRLLETTHSVPHWEQRRSIDVIIRKVTVMPQPQGTLFAGGLAQVLQLKERVSMVLDMGGGTCDYFVAEGMQPLPQRCGATKMGTLACAAAVCEVLKPGLGERPRIVARVDEALRTGASKVVVEGEELDISQCRPAVDGVLRTALQQMIKTIGGSLAEVDTVFFTGGGARMLRDAFLRHHGGYRGKSILADDHVFTNVRGFQVFAESVA